jgi:hypothetical protein
MDGMRGAWQPVDEKEAVERSEDQPLGATGGAGDDADVGRPQAMGLDVTPGGGAGMKAEGGHGRTIAAGGYHPYMFTASDALILQPHPGHPATAVESLTATVRFAPDGGLALRYRCVAGAGTVRIPAPEAGGFAEGLWQCTCCECFAGTTGDPGYREFNFSPSGKWAVFAFSACRQRIPLDPAAVPLIEFTMDDAGWTLAATIPAALLPVGAALDIGLCAVIESADGTLDYRALTHPRPVPDFHDRRGFVLRLPSSAAVAPA